MPRPNGDDEFTGSKPRLLPELPASQRLDDGANRAGSESSTIFEASRWNHLILRKEERESAPTAWPAIQPVLPRRPSWTILFVAGDPSANGNRFDREIAYMRTVLTEASVIERSSVSGAQLRRAVDEAGPAVLHISAHAAGGLVALHADGSINWVPFEDLAGVLRPLPPPLLLVLNICGGRDLAIHLYGWATTTIFWDGQISDSAARAFSVAFYREMVDGASVVKAASVAQVDSPQLLGQEAQIQGRSELTLTGRSYWDSLGR